MSDQIAEYYENDPNAQVWRSESGNRKEIGLYIGYCIAEELKVPRSQTGKTIILSAASNVGAMEQGIQQEAGENFLVISNDFANVPRLDGAVPLRSDARQLPFDADSIPCIVDIAGALWHQLADDMLDSKLIKKKSIRGRQIIEQYKQKIKQGGYLLIDDGFEKSTGEMLDLVLGAADLEGFEKPILLGEEPFILRVYKRL